MTIPKDHEFFPKVMESVQDGKEHSIAEIKEYCVTNSNFTKEQLDQRYPKSGDFVLLDRIGWAIAELKAAGLLEIPNRGMYKITEIGKEILTKHPENLTRKYLHQYGKYKIFAENYIKNKDLLQNKFGVDLNQNLNLTEENELTFADELKGRIPAYHKFYNKVMESVEDGKEHSIKEIKNYCATTSNFTEEELSLKYPKTGEYVILNKVGWAIAYLKNAGLLEIQNRGMYKITELGKEIFTKHPENLTHKFLSQYGSYKHFKENYLKNKNSLNDTFSTGKNELTFADELKGTIPAYHKFFPKIMESVKDGKEHSTSEIENYCILSSNFNKDQLELRYLKSGDPIILTRISWAISELKQAGLIEKPTKAMYKITNIGKEILNKHPENLTFKYLSQYGDIKKFEENYIKNKNIVANTVVENMSFEQDSFLNYEPNEDPIEKIEKAFNEINESLCKNLLNEIMKISPYNFEDLVIKLLVKMGYGSEKFNEKALTQKSFDEGIDGIVNADKFGFESIYTQAKRWDPKSTIGRPEIQKFIGALVGKGASKGLFITTAQFTREAINYAERQYNPKIVLVDGKYLTELMLEYDIGTNISKTFKIKRIDSEFFRSEISLAYCR